MLLTLSNRLGNLLSNPLSSPSKLNPRRLSNPLHSQRSNLSWLYRDNRGSGNRPERTRLAITLAPRSSTRLRTRV